MMLLSPADPTVPIVWDSRDSQGLDVSIRVGESVDASAFVIRTMKRTGQRMDDAGHVVSVADDAHSIAQMAVREALLGALDKSYPRERLHASHREIVDEARAVDWGYWTFTQIMVDGVGFALRVLRQQPPGFVAIADLGPAVVIMRGTELPTDRRYTLLRRPDSPAPPFEGFSRP